VFPSRTRLLGSAEAASGRIGIRFARAVLPDGTEVALSAVAHSPDDGRPGLAPEAPGSSQVNAGVECDVSVLEGF